MNLTIEVILIFSISLCSGWLAANVVSLYIRPSGSKLRRAAIYIVFFIVMDNPSWIGDENPLFIFPVFMVCFLLCYEGPLYKRLVQGLIFFSLIEPICMILDTVVLHSDPHELYYIYRIGLALVKLVIWLIIWLFLRRIMYGKEIFPMSGDLWILLGALSVAPLFSTLAFTFWNAKFFDFDAYQAIVPNIGYTVLPFAAISALALLAAIVVLSRHEQLKQQQKAAELQQVYYQGLRQEQKAVRVLRHDLHNHIAAAKGLLERGDTSGAQRYLERLSNSPGMLPDKRYCENDIADAVISSKAALMEQNNIAADMVVNLPKVLPLSDAELCALLGNALDNAIEASANAQEKRITLRARSDKGMLMMRVDNTFSEPPRSKKDRFVTIKDDAVNHGFGFAVMEEIARLHNGLCEVEYTDADFKLTVSIPLISG